MIKGYGIDELVHLTDTTPGASAMICMAVIMLLVNIAYQTAVIRCGDRKILKLKKYVSLLNQGPDIIAQYKDANRGKRINPHNIKKPDGMTGVNGYSNSTMYTAEEEEEAAEVMRNLGH